MSKPILEISPSGLNSFAGCPKRWAFRKAIISGIDEDRSGIAAQCGEALHVGAQHYMQHRDLDAAIFAMAMKHPISLEQGNYAANAAAYSLEATTTTLTEALDQSPFASYELATFEKDGKKHPAVEIAVLLIIELEHIIIHKRMFVDLILRDPVSGRYIVVDIKTTTPQGSAHFETKYKYDWQTTSYGVPLQGLLGLTGSFQVGIWGMIQSDREPKFPHVIVNRSEKDVDAYYHYLVDKCEQIQKYYMSGRFPRHPQSCVSYGRLCNYHEHCVADTLQEMQDAVNLSGKPGRQGREFTPTFTAHLKG